MIIHQSLYKSRKKYVKENKYLELIYHIIESETTKRFKVQDE